jgi:hypothetical protein
LGFASTVLVLFRGLLAVVREIIAGGSLSLFLRDAFFQPRKFHDVPRIMRKIAPFVVTCDSNRHV